MRLVDYSKRLLSLAEVLHRWLGALAALDAARREKIAVYALHIADTLGRAAAALELVEADPADRKAARQARREFGRIAGYLETMVGVLEHHLDGRKLAGVKRRLEHLATMPETGRAGAEATSVRIDRLVSAEGYFRALADGLRA
jgi:hypothetical protein